MFRRLALAVAGGFLFTTMTAGGVLAGNPAGTGQPSVECGDPGAEMEPAGFLTGGFEVAEENYAGEDEANSWHSNNDKAVSQYDVACYHYTQSH